MRNKRKVKRAVLVASSASPSLFARLATRMVGLLKTSAGLLGAKTIGVLSIGLAAGELDQDIGQCAGKRPAVWERNWRPAAASRPRCIPAAPDARLPKNRVFRLRQY